MPATTIEQEAKNALRAFLKPERMTANEAYKIANGYAITANRIRDEETAREHAEANGGNKLGGFFLENLINDYHVLALLVTGDFAQLATERERILEETTQQVLEVFK